MMKTLNHPILVALFSTVTVKCVLARSWVDTVDPSVYANAIIDPFRSTMSIEKLDNDGDKEILGGADSPTLAPTSTPVLDGIGTPTISPTTIQIEAPECSDGEILHVLRMHDSWGDGWDNSSMTITEIVPTMSTGDVSTSSRYHVVSFSQTTFMEEEKGDILFQGSLDDGYEEFVYLCIPIETCFSIEVLGEGDWQDEIKWDISNVASCTGTADACYEEAQETYAKGVAPAECRFSVPDEDGLFKCPFSCRVYTEAPSGAPTDQPTIVTPTTAPSLDPSAFPSFSSAPDAAFFPSAVPSTPIVSDSFPNTSNVIMSDVPSQVPSDAPSLVPSGVPSEEVNLNFTSPSAAPSLNMSFYPTITAVPTVSRGHGIISMDNPALAEAMTSNLTTTPVSVRDGSAADLTPPHAVPSMEPATSGSQVADDCVVATYDYEEGQRVWASWMGMAEMYEGVVDAVNTNSSDITKTYNITFTDDETFEAYLSSEKLFPIELTKDELESRPPIFEGQQVQARFMGDIYWFDAKVTKDNGNGTFTLLYSDGDEETNVGSEYILFQHCTDGTIVEVDPTDTMEDVWYSPSPAPSLTSAPNLGKLMPTANQPMKDSSTAGPTDHVPSPSTAGLSMGNDFSFKDRLDSALQASNSSLSASSQFPISMPTASPVSNIATTSDSPSNSPFSSPQSSFASVVLSPSQLPSDSPSSNPVEGLPTVLLVQNIPPSLEQSKGSAVLPLIETESLAPSRHPSARSTMAATIRPSPILQQPVNMPPFVMPIDEIVSSIAPPIAAQTSVEDTIAFLDSLTLPESLHGKITGKSLVHNDEGTKNFPAESDQTTTTSSTTHELSSEPIRAEESDS